LHADLLEILPRLEQGHHLLEDLGRFGRTFSFDGDLVPAHMNVCRREARLDQP